MKQYLVVFLACDVVSVASVDSLDDISSTDLDLEEDILTVVDVVTGMMYTYYEGRWDATEEVSGIATV